MTRFAIAAAVVIAAFVASGPAFAITTLKKVQVTDGAQIDLMFDGRITPAQVRTEYLNDIIQLSLTDVSVYPAKITSISGAELTKVFAYQYSPKLVRCRLTVKGKAEAYQHRVEVKLNGKQLSVRIKGDSPATARSHGADQIALGAAAVARVAPGSAGDQSPAALANGAAAVEPVKMNSEEKALLDRVMSGAPAAPEKAAEKATEVAAEKMQDKPVEKALEAERAAARSPRLTTGKSLPNPLRSIGMLGFVLALFGGLVLVVRRFRGPNLQKHKGMKGLLGSMGLGAALKGKGKLIEVVATHYLGPRKSIAMVRIGGRTLVLGVTNDSINLITQLAPGAAGEFGELSEADVVGESGEGDFLSALGVASGAGDPISPKIAGAAAAAGRVSQSGGTGALAAGPALFAGAQKLAGRLVPQQPQPQTAEALARASIRAQIKSRIEGMKPL